MKSINTYLIIFSLASLSLVIASFNYEKEGPAIIETTMPMWEMTKTHTLEVLDAMPEEKFNYQPNAESMTFAEQMVHIAYTLEYFNEGMIQGKDVKYEQPDASAMSKAEIRSMMEANMDTIMESISQLSDDQLNETRPFGPKKITVAQVVLFAHDHTTNHRAKANLYIRMNDIKPPNYKFI